MKRFFSLSILFFILVFYGNSEDLARIVSAEGKAFTLVRNSETYLYDLEEVSVNGLTLYSGDMILTEQDTFIEVQILSGDSYIIIGGDTTFIFEHIRKDGGGVFKLIYGRVRANVGKLPPSTDFYITGYNTVAGVLGTDFGYDLLYNRKEENPEIISRVYCFDGTVEVAWIRTESKDFSEFNKMGYDQDIRGISDNEMITLSSRNNEKANISDIEQEIYDYWKIYPFRFDQNIEDNVVTEDLESFLPDVPEGKRKDYQTAGIYTMGIGCGIMFTSLLFYSFFPNNDVTSLAFTFFGGGLASLGLGYIGLSFTFPKIQENIAEPEEEISE